MAVAVENWVAMVVGVRRVFGSEGAALGCCYTGAFEGMGLIRADSGGEDPGYADMLACREGGHKPSGRSDECKSRPIAGPGVQCDCQRWGRGSCLVLSCAAGGRQLVADVGARDKSDGKRWYSRRSRRWGHGRLDAPVWLSSTWSGGGRGRGR